MEVIEGEQVHITAKRKAQYSQYDWVVWRGNDGVKRASRVSAKTVKTAMLATGTQKRFTVYQRRTGIAHITSWRIAVNIYGHLVRGWYYS